MFKAKWFRNKLVFFSFLYVCAYKSSIYKALGNLL